MTRNKAQEDADIIRFAEELDLTRFAREEFGLPTKAAYKHPHSASNHGWVSQPWQAVMATSKQAKQICHVFQDITLSDGKPAITMDRDYIPLGQGRGELHVLDATLKMLHETPTLLAELRNGHETVGAHIEAELAMREDDQPTHQVREPYRGGGRIREAAHAGPNRD